MRTEKVSILNEVIERVKDSDFCFVLNYGGLSVAQLTALRKELAKHDARAMVVKNTYLGRVAKEQGWADVSGMLTGPTAIITGRGDVAEVAKALVEFVKKNDKAAIKGANLDAAMLSAADVEALSKLPSKDAMRGILLGTLQAPATSLVRVLNAPLLNVLYALKAYEEKKNGSAA
ncbi:MAG TPA: 50S ribosomal protein L10 [Kiritimatiellia bacterium]|nr:50S ribosomal protein L10 [Kiritimatiellia bacterium]HOM58640.1 50S ribosomal protein L10 [Kiritimatiellia bacterium]HOR97213.1 50S ribosomal protein L10 [Kiritimatiellia bacterium]HPK37688.1 50S ribosomal protein L10 [Kiritimatiellia bacterium]HRU19434.1 50S ribosomal protein L10 [Kiritimatiellia bacterium]